MRLVIRLLASVNRRICDVGVAVACLFLVLMTAAVLLQVISREMRDPIGWTEEVALAAMVWVAFLVGPWAYRQHQFTRIDIAIESLRPRTRAVLHVAIHLFEAALLVGAIAFSWRFFQGGTSLLPAMTRLAKDIATPFLSPEAVSTLAVRNYIVYIVLPLGFAGLLLVSIEHVLRAVVSVATGVDHTVGHEDTTRILPAGVTGAALPEDDQASDTDDWDRP